MGFPAAYAITADSLTAETFRQAPSSILAGTGVVGSGDFYVTQNGTPNMSVNVAAGQIWIPGTLASTTGFPNNINAQTGYGLPSTFNEQASYYGWNNGTVNLTIAASNPTNPRIDLIVASIQDAQYSGSNNQPVLQVITGTPAASPVAPSAPASSVVLAQIAVAANATSIVTGNITDERPFAYSIPSQPVAARLYAAAQTVVANNTYVEIALADTDYSEGGMTVGSSQITVPVTGVYQVSGSIGWQFSGGGVAAAGTYTTEIYVNGYAARQMNRNLASSEQGFTQVADAIYLTAGAVLALYGHQNSGTNEASFGSGLQTWLSAALVGGA